MDNVVKLDFPLSANEFKDFLPIAKQRGITPVFGNDFMKLKSLISQYNDIPYLEKCKSLSVPLKDVKKGNWLMVANECGRKYLTEAQFRKYYVDYFLMSLSDDNKIYSEVDCIRNGKRTGIVDNVILFGGRYLSVEIKLSIRFDIIGLMDQLQKYVDVEKFKGVCEDKEEIWDDLVMVIDIFGIYIYEKDKKDTLNNIKLLGEIRCMADIRKFSNEILEE